MKLDAFQSFHGDVFLTPPPPPPPPLFTSQSEFKPTLLGHYSVLSGLCEGLNRVNR